MGLSTGSMSFGLGRAATGPVSQTKVRTRGMMRTRSMPCRRSSSGVTTTGGPAAGSEGAPTADPVQMAGKAGKVHFRIDYQRAPMLTETRSAAVLRRLLSRLKPQHCRPSSAIAPT